MPPVEVDAVQPLFKQPLIDNRDGFFNLAKPVSALTVKFALWTSVNLSFAAECGPDA